MNFRLILRVTIHGFLALIGWLTFPLVFIEGAVAFGLVFARGTLMAMPMMALLTVVGVTLRFAGFIGPSLICFCFFLLGTWFRFGQYLYLSAQPMNRPQWLRDQTVYEAAALGNRVIVWVAISSLVIGIIRL